ncbi:MAG: PAS domain S-box protein, partial [Candidatus Methylumidiphilus sp.]
METQWHDFCAASGLYFAHLPGYAALVSIALLGMAGLVSLRRHRERMRTAEALRESEFLFRAQFDLGNIGIAIISPDKGWLRANPKLCQMLGYSEAELMRCRWTELTHPEDVAAAKAQYKRMLAGETDSYEMDKRLIRKDGLAIHAHLTVACHREEGRVRFIVAGLMDITERKSAEEEMKLAALLYQNSNEAMTVTDANGVILNVNPAFTRLTGYAAEEVVGKNPRILQSGRHDWAFYHKMWQAINTTGHWQGEIWNKRKDGEVYAEWLSINTIHNEDGSVHRRVALFSDISEKKKSEELIWNQANFDFLTQLPNRRMFHDRLAQEVKKAARNRMMLALLFIDLDRFKEVNDTLGHDMGDLLLKDASQRLTSCVREADTVARLGGDEFTVILGGLNNPGGVERTVQTILKKLAEPFLLGEEKVYVSGSIGITFYPKDGVEVEA